MFTIYKTNGVALGTVLEPMIGSWINVVDPSAEEITQLQETLNVPQDFITYPLDQNEMPRVEKENGAMLIMLRVPSFQGEGADIPYVTVPLGIILTDRYIATICSVETNVIQAIVLGRVRGLSTGKRNRFVLQILLMMANRFLNDLREINKAVDTLEDRLQHSLRNRELLELLKCQKSLVYFTTALKGNELTLGHLQRSQLFQQYPDDQDLLDDVLTEIQQAIEMTNISSNILSSMMDAFASIISNNLNVVMKVLASITIVVSLPTMVSSFFGMNVALPLAEYPFAFAIIFAVASAVSLTVLVALWRKDWL
ncbi:MAG: magnesium transporter CorA family protein [Anaerolineales bacterium]|nr:magnesium transporter CorA family protein [Anaerolineales bacterium]